MKAILKFNLPEENEEFEMASQASKLYYAVSEFDNFLRNKIKHSDLTDEQYNVYESVRQELWNNLNNENISLH
jgi:hypothetical protein